MYDVLISVVERVLQRVYGSKVEELWWQSCTVFSSGSHTPLAWVTNVVLVI